MKRLILFVFLIFTFHCYSQNCNLNVTIQGDTSILCYGSSPEAISALVTGGTFSDSTKYGYRWYNNNVFIGDTSWFYQPGNIHDSASVYVIVFDSLCGYDTSNLWVFHTYEELLSNISGVDTVIPNHSPGNLICNVTGGTGNYSFYGIEML